MMEFFHFWFFFFPLIKSMVLKAFCAQAPKQKELRQVAALEKVLSVSVLGQKAA